MLFDLPLSLSMRLALIAAAPMLAASAVKAQEPPGCVSTAALPSDQLTAVREAIERDLTGSQEMLSRLKDMTIDEVIDVAFLECRVVITAEITVKRKLRRNANGRIALWGTPDQVRPAARRDPRSRLSLCVSDFDVRLLRLSRARAPAERRTLKRLDDAFADRRCFVADWPRD